MIVLRKLNAEAKEENYHVAEAHHGEEKIDLGKGKFGLALLGFDGLTVVDGDTRVAIPQDDLLALAEPHLAKLRGEIAGVKKANRTSPKS